MEIGSGERRYKILRSIGEGGMAKVYEAKELSTNKRRAVKHIQVPASYSFKEGVSRFEREYLILRSLSHSNIVRAYDFFTEEPNAFMVLQYVQGLSLRDFIRDRKEKLSFKEQLAICIQIARAVEYINTAGILHRDIKPGNIVLNEVKKKATLLDLGIAKNLETNLTRLTRTGEIVGTPSYLSPEQVGGDITENSDVFSLAVVLYQFLAWEDHSPFQRNNYIATLTAISTYKVPSLHQVLGNRQSKSVSEILDKALEKKSEKRIQTAKHFADLLQEVYENCGQEKSQWNVPQPLNASQAEKLQFIGEKYGRDSVFARRVKRISKRRQKKQQSSTLVALSIAAALFLVLVVVHNLMSVSVVDPDVDDYEEDYRKEQVDTTYDRDNEEKDTYQPQKKKPVATQETQQQESKSKAIQEKYLSILQKMETVSPFEKWKLLEEFVKKYRDAAIAGEAKRRQATVEIEILTVMADLQEKINKGYPSRWAKLTDEFTNLKENFLQLKVSFGKLHKAFGLLQESYDKFSAKVRSFRKDQEDKINRDIKDEFEKALKTRQFATAIFRLGVWDDNKFAKAKIEILSQLQKLFRKVIPALKKNQRRGRKVSISLTNGKFIRGYVTKIGKDSFSLKDYKNNVYKIEYTTITTKTIDKLVSKLDDKDLYYLGLLSFVARDLPEAKMFVARIKKPDEEVQDLVKQITAKISKLEAQKRKVSFISPADWLGKNRVSLSSDTLETLFQIEVTGGKPVEKVLVNGQLAKYDEETSQYTYLVSFLGKDINEIKVEIINRDSSSQEYNWIIDRVEMENFAMFRGSPERTGFYPTGKNFKPRNLKWSFKAKKAIHTSPIGAYNMVYFGSDAGIVYAVDAQSGKEKWQQEIKGIVYATPAIDKGVVYIGSLKRKLYALHATTGEKLWDFPVRGEIKSSAVVVDGIVFFASVDKHVYAVDVKKRNLLWKYKTNGGILSSPVIKNNVLYIASKDKHIYALHYTSGKLLWKYKSKREFEYSTPAVYGNYIHFTSIDGAFYSLSMSGKQKLRYETSESIYASPCLLQGVAYIANKDGDCYGIHLKSGKRIWEAEVNNPISTSPIVTSKSMYFTCQDGYIYELDRKSGQETWSYNIGIEITKSSPMIYRDTLYFGGDNGHLYAFD
ncbi:protein kinase [Candidatus Uabimicrobium amorphum]|uniref:Protein kinase n=1 Tax=Uabimicrobium amorphum TaxID=2596890 RepID=A0A5S9IJH2_UABAM|nr:protein kinase [Candidatus Uabimicrobium amorphum]